MLKPIASRAKTIALRTEIAMAARGLHLRRELRLPDFIGIGTPISGSTWLSANIDMHPEASLSRHKETRFFSHHLDRGLGWYSSEFSHCSDKIAGEFTPGYGKLPLKRIWLIRKLMPNVRLIMIMRDPIDRAWAGARRTFTKMAEHWGCSFADIPKAEFLSFFELDHEYNAIILNRGGEYDQGMNSGYYSRIIDNWLGVFPDEQLLTIFYEDIKDHPSEVLSRVFDHIGVTTNVDFATFSMQRINSNPQHEMPTWAREKLEEMYLPEIERMRERFGERLPDWG